MGVHCPATRAWAHSYTFSCALSHVLGCSLTRTFTPRKSVSGGCKAISGITWASCRHHHLKGLPQRAWENAVPGAHLSEARDRKEESGDRSCSQILPLPAFSEFLTSCLNLLLVSHGGNNIVAFSHCHTLFQIITQ